MAFAGVNRPPPFYGELRLKSSGRTLKLWQSFKTQGRNFRTISAGLNPEPHVLKLRQTRNPCGTGFDHRAFSFRLSRINSGSGTAADIILNGVRQLSMSHKSRYCDAVFRARYLDALVYSSYVPENWRPFLESVILIASCAGLVYDML